MLFLCHAGWATTVEEFIKVTPGLTIQVTNDSANPWTVNENGELTSNMHDAKGETIISFTNTSPTDIYVSFEWEIERVGISDMSMLYYSVGDNANKLLNSLLGYEVALTLPATTALNIKYKKSILIGSTNVGGYGIIKNLNFTQPQSYTDDYNCTWTFYPFSDHTAKVISFSGSAEEVIIPSTLSFGEEEYVVTSIMEKAFKDNTAITSVTIPECVTSIGNYAFSGCTNLSNVSMGENVALGIGTFEGTNMMIGNGGVFGTYADSDGGIWGFTINGSSTAASITSYTGPATEMVIPSFITYKDFEYPVNAISANAFKDNAAITSVTIPESVSHIGDYAFYGCICLRNVTMSDNVVLGTDVFTNTSIYSDQNVTGSYTDSNGSLWGYQINQGINGVSITSYSGNDFLLVVPTEIDYNGARFVVKKIESNVFKDNVNITSVTLPNSLHTIGEQTFYNCTNLISVNIPDAVTSIGNMAFRGCSSLATVNISANSALQSIGSYAFNGCSLLASFAMPDGVTSIGSNAFYNCSKLASIKIPDGVKTIGSSAFYGCSSLRNVEISDNASLETIENYAFRGCYALESFNFTANLKSIGSWAFATDYYWWNNNNGVDYVNTSSYMSLKSIDLTKCTSLTTIGEYAFFGTHATKIDMSGCTSLISIGNNAFSGNNYVSELDMSGCSSLTTISDAAFCRLGYNQTNGCSIKLDGCNTLTAINQVAFYNSYITSINLSECTALQSIGSYAFASCPMLAEVTIPDAVTAFGTYAFYNDTRLKTINFGNDSALRSIGNYAFQNCSSLQGITLPKGVGSINSYTFSDCSALKTIVIPAYGDLESIGMNAFENCSSLSVLAVPATVTSIASSAFNFGVGKTVLVFASADPAGYDANMFNNLGENNNVRVKIPANALEVYQTKYPDIAFIYTDVERIELNHEELNASVNNDYAFTATVYPEDAVSAIQWTTSDESVATIDAEGRLHGVAEGTVTITAMSLDGSEVKAECPVTVTFVNMQGIQLAKESYWLKSGGYGNVGITTTPTDASDRNVTFTTSDPEIATVDENGKVTALSVGKCTITATSVSNPDVTATTEIDVRAYKPARWIVEDNNGDGYFTLKDAETGLYAYYSGNYLPENSSYCSITASNYGEGNSRSEWLVLATKSNDSKVTEIEDGKDYYLYNRCYGYWVTRQYDKMAAYRSSSSSYASTVQFKKLDDGTYNIALDGSLLQEGANEGNTLSMYSATGGNDDWDYTVTNSIFYPETLSAMMTSYKSAATDVVMPENVKYDGAMYPVYGANSSLDGCNYVTSITLPSTFRLFRMYQESGAYNAYYGTFGYYYPWEQGSYAPNLRSIIIPEGVTNIPSYTFYSCENLDNVVLPSTVKNIDNYAFGNCTGLTNIKLSAGLNTLGDYAFNGCNQLNSIEIPASNETFATADGVLYKKDYSDIVLFPKGKTGSYTIPSTMTAIRSSLFESAKIGAIAIPSSIESIGERAFYNCNALTEITIPASVKNIENNAFNASLLSKINLVGDVPATLASTNSFYSDAFFFVPDEQIDTYKAAPIWNDMENRIFTNAAFTEVTNTAKNGRINLAENIGIGNEQKVVGLKVHGTVNGWDIMVMNTKMSNLRYLDLSDARIVADEGYKYYSNYSTQDNVLGAYSFYQMSNLRTIALPKDITSIGSYALAGCGKLTSVTGIGENVSTISSYAFQNCYNLPSISIPSSVNSIGNYAFQSCSGLQDVTFSEGLASIGSYAFESCSRLKSLKLPNSLNSIGSYAFSGCNKLEEIIFPKDLKEINYAAFQYCSGLKELKLPSNLERIYNYAFNGCTSLKAIHIPSMLKSIGDYAFTNCGAQDVYAYTLAPVPVTANTFDYSKAVLHAPNSPYSVFLSYYADNGWRKFLNVLPFDAEYDRWYLGEDQDLTLDKDETIPNVDGEQAEGEMNAGSGIIMNSTAYQWLDKLNLKWKEGKAPSVLDNGSMFVDELVFTLDVKANKWYFFCFPFDIELNKAKFNGKFVWRYYDGEERAANGQGAWKNIGGNKLEAFKGYIFQTNTAGEIELTVTDPIFVGGSDKEVSLEQHASDNAQDAGWNFIGNPELCYFDLSSFIGKFNCPITVWDPMNNTYNAVVPGDDDYEFYPFQGFFIQKPVGENAIEFSADDRQTYTQSQETMASRAKSRASRSIDMNRRIVNVAISNGVQTDRTRVVFNDNKSMDYEPEYDASKFFSTEAVPQIYTLDNKSVKYAINERPNRGNTVSIGFVAPADGTYTILPQRMDMVMALKDNETGAVHSFADGSYEFSAKAGTYDGRFTLMPDTNTTGVNGLQTIGIVVDTANGGITLGGLNGKTATVFTLNGIQVATITESGHCDVPTGTYLVSVEDKSSKVVVR